MRIYRLGAIAAIGLLAACGGGDDAEPAASNTDGIEEPADEPAAESADEPAAESADEPAAESADEPTNDADETNDADDGGSTLINSLDDIPQECRQIMGDFMREIEPIVQDIDWQNVTMAELESFGDSIDAPVSEIDSDMEAAGCDDLGFDGDDDDEFELVIEFARQEAPGIVGWLEFIRDASTSFDISAEGTVDQAADAPETCDEAIDAVRALMEQSDTMMDLPVDEVMAAGNTISNITTVCSIDEMQALFEDPDFLAWAEG